MTTSFHEWLGYGCLALVAPLLGCSSNTAPINPPVEGWNCSLTITVNGETEELFELLSTHASSGADSLLYTDGGVACRLIASASGTMVTFRPASTCGDPRVESLTMTWDVNSGSITGSAKTRDDGGNASGMVIGSCGPVFGS
jgi:hypothetical protein